MLIMRHKAIVFFLTLVVISLKLNGQGGFLKKLFIAPYDTNYITSYVTDFTTRIFSSVKYSQMGYNDNLVGKSLAYKPNNRLLFGVGVNHGFLGLNIGVNFPFVNQDDDKYGETKYYDFTLRVFSRRFNTTLYLQNYRGFYLRNTKDMIPGWEEGDPYYIRGDIRSYSIGLDINYIFNSSRFSCRAAVLQNEWQKKSAGSFLVGGSLFYNVTTGDSSIVPKDLYYGLFYNDLKFDVSTIFSMGPTFGYAYTFVIKKHFFILGSINGSVNIGYTELHLVQNEDKIKSGTVAGLRTEVLLSAGYNSDRWYFGFTFFDMTIATQAPIDERSISYQTGMYRFNIVRRFATNKPIRLLNPGI